MSEQTLYHSIPNKYSTPNYSKKNWLSRLNQIIDKNPGDPFLSNEKFAKGLETSERNLIRKVKKMSGLTPQKYLRQYRMKLAMKYLIVGKYRTVNATATNLGYTNVGYFINQFEKEFGRKPLEVLKENGWR